MSRIMRSLLLLVLILSVLPPASARAQNTPVWQGTIVYVFHLTTRLEFTYYAHPNYYPTTSHSVETMRVQIDVRADGTGVQTTTYEKTVALEQGSSCYGHYWGTARATSTVTLPAPVVWVDDEKVIIYPSNSPTTVVRESNWDSCWWGGDEAGWLPPTGSPVAPYIQEWYHNGAFTTEDTWIVGRDRWANWGNGPGGNYVDKRTPYSTYGGEGYFTETSVRFTSYNLTREEQDTPWLSQEWKDALNEASWELGKFSFASGMTAFYLAKTGRLHLALVPEILSLSAGAASLLDGWLAKDPPDPNFTEIAIPVTPTTSQQPILPNDDLSQTQADTLNAVIENFQQGIGLAQAMLTSFNRASGAQVASNSYWVNRQLQVARLYSGQLADVLDAQLPLLADLQQALLTAPALSFAVTAQDLLSFKSNLVINGLSGEQSQLLTELGMDARGREEILNALLETEIAPGALPGDTIAIFPDFFTDEDLIASTQNVAAALREFSQSGATVERYLPLILR